MSSESCGVAECRGDSHTRIFDGYASDLDELGSSRFTAHDFDIALGHGEDPREHGYELGVGLTVDRGRGELDDELALAER
jgi:hypothetical protein